MSETYAPYIEESDVVVPDAEAPESAPAPSEAVAPEYVWPKATDEQRRRSVPGGDAGCRVVKVGYTDPWEQFDDAIRDGRSVKQVRIGQYRVPMANNKFDIDRLQGELRKWGMDLIENVFPDGKHYCELNNCWELANSAGSFCSRGHEQFALTAHNRSISFE